MKNIRSLMLTVSTVALPLLAGCATTQAGTPEGTATAQQEVKMEAKSGCACAQKAQDGMAQASDEKKPGCGCPHCAGKTEGTDGQASKCACGHGAGSSVAHDDAN